MIVVLPNGNRSFFVNSVSAPTGRFEDVIVKDLIDYVDSHYRTIAAREGRAIAGISMGGFGATVLGLRHPDLFRTVGALSASLGSARAEPSGENTAGTQMIFGRPGTPERRERDPLALVTDVTADSAPYFYISCGAEDALLSVNRQFVRLLADRRVSARGPRSARRPHVGRLGRAAPGVLRHAVRTIRLGVAVETARLAMAVR